MIGLLQATWQQVDCSACTDWPGIITALSTLIGALGGALGTYVSMRSDYHRGRSLRPRARRRQEPPESE